MSIIGIEIKMKFIITGTGKLPASVSTIAKIDVGSRTCPPFLDFPEVLLVFLSTFLDTSKFTFLISSLLARTGWEGANVIKQILLE